MHMLFLVYRGSRKKGPAFRSLVCIKTEQRETLKRKNNQHILVDLKVHGHDFSQILLFFNHFQCFSYF